MGDKTIKWLKKNDPKYLNRSSLDYFYLDGQQMRRRIKTEIPASCLTTYLAQEWTGMDGEQLKEVQDLFT